MESRPGLSGFQFPIYFSGSIIEPGVVEVGIRASVGTGDGVLDGAIVGVSISAGALQPLKISRTTIVTNKPDNFWDNINASYIKKRFVQG